MPLYEYICDHCQLKFDALRSMAQADEPIFCPRCGNPETKRVISSFAAFSKGEGARSIGGSSCASCSASSCAACK